MSPELEYFASKNDISKTQNTQEIFCVFWEAVWMHFYESSKWLKRKGEMQKNEEPKTHPMSPKKVGATVGKREDKFFCRDSAAIHMNIRYIN